MKKRTTTTKKRTKKKASGPARRGSGTSPRAGRTAASGQQNDGGRLTGAKSNDREPRGDWRVETLARVRAIIRQAVPNAEESVKWRKPSNSMAGVPVWSHAGIICTGETYKDKVKLTFAKGASLPDPSGLFNSSLEGSTRRAIDLHEGDELNERALQALVRSAAAKNMEVAGRGRKSGR